MDEQIEYRVVWMLYKDTVSEGTLDFGHGEESLSKANNFRDVLGASPYTKYANVKQRTVAYSPWIEVPNG